MTATLQQPVNSVRKLPATASLNQNFIRNIAFIQTRNYCMQSCRSGMNSSSATLNVVMQHQIVCNSVRGRLVLRYCISAFYITVLRAGMVLQFSGYRKYFTMKPGLKCFLGKSEGVGNASTLQSRLLFVFCSSLNVLLSVILLVE